MQLLDDVHATLLHVLSCSHWLAHSATLSRHGSESSFEPNCELESSLRVGSTRFVELKVMLDSIEFERRAWFLKLDSTRSESSRVSLFSDSTRRAQRLVAYKNAVIRPNSTEIYATGNKCLFWRWCIVGKFVAYNMAQLDPKTTILYATTTIWCRIL